MTISTSTARTTTTISIGVMGHPRGRNGRPPPSVGPHPERQSVHLLHAAAPPARQRRAVAGPHAPRRAAQLGLADAARGEVLHEDRLLADQGIDRRPRRLATLHPLEERLAE